MALGILLLALLLRGGDFGNPVIHVDEQFYLLVGERMHEGLLPYLDIWDRKPVGLFLLYAAITALPGDGVLAYQVVATLFAAATALAVAIGAGRLGASRRGMWAAAAATLLWTSLLGGRGGQAPVFYNLPVVLAALLTLRLPSLTSGRAVLLNGVAACLLAGLAIQVKYLPAIEGAWFGLAHLWFARRHLRVAGAAAAALLWIGAGLLPTVLALGWYAALGRHALDAYWFANFGSILSRPGYPAEQLAMRLLGIVAQLSPLIVSASLAWRWRVRGARAVIAFGWLGAAVLGFFAIGTFFDHYALPLVPPLAMIAGRAFGRSGRAAVASLGLAAMLFAVERTVARDDATGARAVARVVAANSAGGCPYVFIGDTITYTLARACLPTPYVFPNLLAYTTEQGATGIDEAAEVRRILAHRPPVIVTSDRKLDIWNRASLAAVNGAIARNYRLVFSAPRSNYRTLVYLRRDLPLRD
ncbi:hypothetical protein DVW87_03135 [Sphingomonas aracearum]|uniref:Glycosyltransferase RgtA/B/C/D-like domain-containing protein n=1 Tax=Sphingomonas aracearum TaxID=2283317 RepID=A0A369W2F3_9SPHN|nr:hypothetical protein DVW87_03135 [Sphingomonas aracearum]